MSQQNGEKDTAAAATLEQKITATDEPSMTVAAQDEASTAQTDPLLELPSPVIRDGDCCILVFADGKQYIVECVKRWKSSKVAPLKINKRLYSTANLIGLPYGTVLEVGNKKLIPLPEGQDLLPDHPVLTRSTEDSQEDTDGEAAIPIDETTEPQPSADNRHLVDDNKSQSMGMKQLMKLKHKGNGSEIVQALIENSSTFDSKTDFSKQKYIARKQKKYQQRCRIVRCTPSTVCEALFLKDPRKLMNLREDTLGQILSYSNVTAGCHVLVMETCMGVVSGALAQRMGGYGKIFTLYAGQQPNILEMLSKFNLSFAESHSIKYVHAGDVFCEDAINVNVSEQPDAEKEDRELLQWPCPLQDHTRAYLETMTKEKELDNFMTKRCSRFARKLTRHSPTEAQEMLLSRPCDSIVIACRYNPTETLLKMLPFLAPSCPFVVYCEFMEPLVECFEELQRRGLAINLKLSDTWMREYQVLPGRTHPNMNMSQNGGFLLVGIKLCPVSGHNELDESLLKEIRAKLGGRRGRKPKAKRGSSPKNTAEDARDCKRARGNDS
jgi:tRNA (adenine-N(1)-)-methyltransferase non-catalytic subunit